MNGGGPRRVVILHHENYRERPDAYLIQAISRIWREKGCEVTDLRGTKKVVPADLIVVHVDRSVVDPVYLEFAARYPRAFNAGVSDIRKRCYCEGLVVPGDGYEGPVIVKSDLNHGGKPEHNARKFRLGRKVFQKGWRMAEKGLPQLVPPPAIVSKKQYRIYASAAKVPPVRFRDDRVVVQRFLPEMSGGRYLLRKYLFCGDAYLLQAELSEHPIISGGTDAPVLAHKEVPGEVLAFRERMKLDYGKIDYGVCGGRVVIYDCNKTMGRSDPEERGRRSGILAAGIWGAFAAGRLSVPGGRGLFHGLRAGGGGNMGG